MSPETLELFKNKETAGRWPHGILDDGIRHHFTERLVASGVISEEHAYAALLEQKVNPDHRIGHILVRNGHATAADITSFIETENPERLVYESVSASRVPHTILAEHLIIINAETLSILYVSTGDREHRARELLEEYYPDKRIEFIDYKPANQRAFLTKMEKIGTGIRTGDTVRPEDLADRLVHQAINRRASDIHINPRGYSFSVFFRILGERVQIFEGSIETYLQMAAQIKDRAEMDMQENRRPQDGKFSVEHGGKLVDVRVSTIPVEPAHEGITLRILDPDRITPDLNKLGITRIEQWKKGIKRKTGICLISGRTGSGKTTTLRASILQMERMKSKIVSVEDPVEYQIPFVQQTAVNDLVELGFATASRASMRQDPDTIILGEIRDLETAHNAVRLAETGHLVLATLHATDVLTALMRLNQFDVPFPQLRELVRCILVQDLVRTVCPHCHNHPDRRVGCKVCGGIGYNGQTIISECEYFPYPESLDPFIKRVRDGEDHRQTWPLMIEDALLKMDQKITDRAEIERVFSSEFADHLERLRAAEPQAPPIAPT